MGDSVGVSSAAAVTLSGDLGRVMRADAQVDPHVESRLHLHT